MISQTAEYALRAIVVLAQQDDVPRTTQRLSELTEIPVPYLSKIVGALSRAGIVRSQRGPGGGVNLASAPNRVTMWDVVAQIDAVKQFHECPLDNAKQRSRDSELCPLHRKLRQINSAVEHTLRETTIDQLMTEGARSLPLCETEQRART
jgi:Rrf2 family transcriptional regulator, nitric oxide-sensitive transcriptional repressor